MTDLIYVGNVRRLTAKFYIIITDTEDPDYPRKLADPGVVTFRYYIRDDQDEVSKVYGTDAEVKKQSEGWYYIDVPLDTDGYFSYSCQGEGTVDAFDRGNFVVDN